MTYPTHAVSQVQSTLLIMKKKYAEIFHHNRPLYIKGDVFIGEWDIFVQRFLIKGNFIIGRVECIYHTHSNPKQVSIRSH